MKLYFIRHGKPKIINNEFYRCHLSDQGIKETTEFAKSKIIPKPDLILSSPFNRAVDTAKVFADHFQMKFDIVECLKEWNLQTLNLLFEEYTIEEEKGWNNHNIVVKGNESLNQVKERVIKGTLDIVESKPSLNTILLVCHGTIIDMLCSVIVGRNAVLSDIKSMKHLDYALIEYLNGELRVLIDIIN